MSMADAAKVATPELDKQSALMDTGAPAAVQDMLDWLEQQGLWICEMQESYTETCEGPSPIISGDLCEGTGTLTGRVTHPADGKRYYEGDTCPACNGTGEVTHTFNQPRYMPTFKTKQALMEGHFGIDPKKVEAERRALLEAIRA